MKIWRYIQGDRKGKEAHRIEKEAMKDPFLADALEGYDQVEGNHQREVARLQKRIANKSANKKSNALKAWGIAASLLIAVGVGTWFLLNDPSITQETYSDVVFEEEREPLATTIPSPGINQDTLAEIPSQSPTAQVRTDDAEKKSKKDVQIPDLTVVMEDAEIVSSVEEESIQVPPVEEEASAEQKIVAEQEVQATAMARVSAESKSVSTESVSTASDPIPVTGMKAYMEYIQRNLKRPTDDECRNATGPVVVVFKIGQSGRPYNIRVTQGLCTSTNQEAIRLIINGPDWKKGSASDEATITINF